MRITLSKYITSFLCLSLLSVIYAQESVAVTTYTCQSGTTLNADGKTCEITYTATETSNPSASTFIVPPLVTELVVTATGSSGTSTTAASEGSVTNAYTGTIPGGKSARITAKLTTTPGYGFTVYVYKRTTMPNASIPTNYGTCKYVTTPAKAFAAGRGGGLARIGNIYSDIIAGGGGGAGCSSTAAGGAGGDAGLTSTSASAGGNATAGTSTGGAPGTDIAGGAGGTGTAGVQTINNGIKYGGGTPTNAYVPGGGGGGGYFGGGAGGASTGVTLPSSGGGGGSSRISNAILISESLVSGIDQASVYISYKLPIVPDAPGTPVVSANTGTPQSFNIAFTPPINSGSHPITSYTAILYIGGTATATKVIGASSPLKLALTSSPPSGTYTFRVFATSAAGDGPSSGDSNGIVVPFVSPATPPEAPTFTTISQTDSTTASVGFNLLTTAQLNGGTFSNYRVTAYLNGVATNISNTGTSSPISISGLTTGATYTFGITATTGAGTSPVTMSSAFTPSIPTLSGTPSAPTFTAANSPGNVTINFAAQSAPAGTSILSYTFTATPVGGGNPISMTVTPPFSSSYTLTGLAPGTSYSISYGATNQAGLGNQSTAATYTVPTPPSSPILTNVDLKFYSATGNVSFNKPSNDGGDTITAYTIYVYPSTGSSGSAANSSSTVETTTVTSTGAATYTKLVTLLHQVTGQTWYNYDSVTVTASNHYGESAPSNLLPLIPGQPGPVTVIGLGNSQITVSPNIPAASAYPDTMTISAYDQTASSASKLAFDYRKTTPAGPTPYQAEKDFGSPTHTYDPPSCIINLPATTCTISGLINNHNYNFIARAFNGSGGGIAGGWIATAVSPVDISSYAPTNVSASKVSGQNAATVSWSIPSYGAISSDTVTANIDTYTITAYSSTGETLVATTSSPSSYNFTGLTNGKSYTFSVKSHTNGFNSGGVTVNAGISAISNQSNSVLIADVPDVPAVPTVTYGGTVASLAFTTPSANGSAITSYIFEATPVGGGGALPTQTTTNLTSPYLFTGLSSTSSYTFKIKATNSIGSSAYSPSSSNPTSTLSVTPVDFSIIEGTATPLNFNKIFAVDGTQILPNTNNSNWSEPTCTSSYTSSSTSGTYPITCSGGNAGTLYSFSFIAGTLTVNAKTKVYVIPNSFTVSTGTPNIDFTKLYETTAQDTSTQVSPDSGNIGWVAPTCNISPAYDSSTTTAGTYDITCSGGNGGALYNLDFKYKGILKVNDSLTPPAAPSNLSISASGTSATLNFTAPSISGTPAYTSYTVTFTPIGGGTPITRTFNSPASSATISNLSSSSSYNVSLVANSSSGSSVPVYAALTTGSAGGGSGGAGSVVLPSAPIAPTNVIATPISKSGSNVVSVSFFSSATGGLQTIYRVTAYTNGVATNISNSGSSSPIIVTGLTPGVAYTFVVTATNIYGTSSLSNPSVTLVLDGQAQTSTGGKTTQEIPTKVGPSKMLKVFFNLNTSFVNAKSRVEIKKYVEFVKSHKGPYTIEVIGVVEPTPIQPFPVAQLSKARATSVAKLLKEAGLVGKYKIVGGGLTSFRGPKARYAQIVVTWAA